jgi:monoamine oxidase
MTIVVVGAGLAGLAAARRLSRGGVEVRVVEARDRVGGRVLNHTFEDGTVVEVGGQWVGPTQDHVLELIADLGLELFDTYDTGERMVSLGGRAKRFKGDTFGLAPHVLVEVAIAQKRLESMAAEVPLDAPWKSPHAAKWDAQTLDTWLRRNLRFARSRDFWRTLTAAIFCAEATEMSLLHFLFYCHSGGMLDRLMGIADGAQEKRIVGGSQRIAQVMAEQLGDALMLNEPVRSIDQSGARIVVATATRALEADAVIVAIPQHLIANIDFQPRLPPRRRQLVQNVPMGAVIKIVARYDRAFWREQNLSGFGVSLDHPVSLTFDNSPPDGSCGMLVGFFEGAHARKASELTPEQRRQVFVGTLSDLFGPEAAAPTEVAEQDWTAEPWSGGCYGAHLCPGIWTQLGEELRKPHGRILWAGTETAPEWNGYMDGAIASGMAAADQLLNTNPT